MFNKLRYQLLSVFIFLSFVLVGLTIISFIYIKQKSKLEDIHQKILDINNYILNNSNTISNFFTYDTKNPEFFISGKSNYLKTHKNNLELIRSEVKNLQQLDGINQFGIIQKISSIKNAKKTAKKAIFSENFIGWTLTIPALSIILLFFL